MDEKSNKHEKKSLLDDDEESTSAEAESDSGTEVEVEADKESSEKRDLASFFKSKKQQETEKLTQDKADKVEVIQNSVETEESEDNLSENEIHEATLAIVDARLQEIGEELENTNPESSEENEILADALFLESLQDLASGEAEITPELIETAYDEAMDDLLLDETPADLSDDEEELTASHIPPPTPPSTPTPPTPPVASTEPGVNPPPTGGDAGNHYFGQSSYNPIIAQANLNSQPVVAQEIHNHRSDLLLGAVLGYIVGRRGGRKRTEKKLFPKIDRLESQVKILHDTILEKEVLIRKIARENAVQMQDVPDNSVAIIERRRTKKQIKETLKRRELLAKDPGVEKIGRFSLPALKVFHERRVPDGRENQPQRKQVEVMTTQELLEKVQGLIIHDLKVTEMFHRGRLSVEALRQITKEYLRNGAYEQTFFKELLPDSKHIETLTSDVHEKNTAHSIDEILKTHFNSEIGKNSTDVNLNYKRRHSQVIQEQKRQKQFILAGITAGIAVMIAILIVLSLN